MKGTISYSSGLKQIHDIIRTGELTLASLELASWIKSHRKLARRDLAPIASLYRRLRKPEAAIRLLHPIVRPASALSTAASTAECAEYAGALIRLGAIQEAEAILAKLPAATYPAVDLFRAFAKIHQWDYAAAIPHLKSYLSSPAVLDAYERRIAQVNLAASLVVVREDSTARELLRSLLEETGRLGDKLLEANLREISAQNEYFLGEFDRVREHLKEAETLIDLEESLDGFFISKWKSLLQLSECPCDRHLGEVKALREKAIQRRHWESVRDLDFQMARITRDEALLRVVYWGSPLKALKSLYEKEARGMKLWDESSEPFRLTREIGNGARVVTLDAETGENSSSSLFLKRGQLPQRTLAALNLDFYRPQRLAELHQCIYPDMYFSPLSSAQRIYQALRRLKAFFTEARIPLNVHERNGFYTLEADPGYRVRLVKPFSKNQKPQERRLDLEKLIERFRSEWTSDSFNSEDFRRKLQIPKRTSLRYLSQAVSYRILERQGAGTKTSYIFN